MTIDVYRPALAKVLRDLVCSGGDNAIFIVRGAGFQSRLAAAGPEAPSLIDEITVKDSKDCPVSALLTDADRAQLQHIKQQAIDAVIPTEK